MKTKMNTANTRTTDSHKYGTKFTEKGTDANIVTDIVTDTVTETNANAKAQRDNHYWGERGQSI